MIWFVECNYRMTVNDIMTSINTTISSSYTLPEECDPRCQNNLEIIVTSNTPETNTKLMTANCFISTPQFGFQGEIEYQNIRNTALSQSVGNREVL